MKIPSLLPLPRVGGLGVDSSVKARLEEVALAMGTAVLRVGVEGGGCSGFRYILDIGAACEGDATLFFDEECKVGVCVDPVSQPFLEGAVLRFEDTWATRRFAVENPNAASGCGCGVSFAVA